MKICKKCNLEKSLEDFYKFKEVPSNKCKQCTKQEVKDREKKNRLNPDWVEKEKARGREKHHRLYRTTVKSKEQLVPQSKGGGYFENYPEKKKAHILSCRVRVQKGNEKHHWSYKKEDAKDIIEMSISEHKKIHKYIVYDQEHFMYRRYDTMELLDTKEKHIEFYNLIKHKE